LRDEHMMDAKAAQYPFVEQDVQPPAAADQYTAGNQYGQQPAPAAAAQYPSVDQDVQPPAPAAAAQFTAGNQYVQPPAPTAAAQYLSVDQYGHPPAPASAAQYTAGNQYVLINLNASMAKSFAAILAIPWVILAKGEKA